MDCAGYGVGLSQKRGSDVRATHPWETDRSRPVADVVGLRHARPMRALAFLLFVAVSAAACAENKPADDRRVVSDEEFVRSFIWSRVPADGWASSPTLVIARRDGLYPAAPDVEVALACLPDGSVSVSGNAYSVGTDVGGPPDVVPRFSLQSDVVSLSGEPIWEHGSFSKHAHFILWLTPDQLSELIRGDWFEVGSIFADGSGTVRYPAPPRTLTIPFLQDCEDAR